jgi:hypothetical protein
MPNAPRPSRVFVFLFAFAVALPGVGRAQQPDSAAARDSVRRDSVARADSLRSDSLRADSIRRSELERIRAEPRARVDTTRLVVVTPDADRGNAANEEPSVTAASVAADMIADLSPKQAARTPGSARMRVRDIEGSLGASYGPRVRGVLTLSLTDDGTAQRLTTTDAAVIVALPLVGTELLVGRGALPFGR